MSCKECEEMQNGSLTSYYRWKNANIEVRACKMHLKEVYDALNKAQRENAELEKDLREVTTCRER